MSFKPMEKYSYEFYKHPVSGNSPVEDEIGRYITKELHGKETPKKKYLEIIQIRLIRLCVNGTVDGRPHFDHIRNTNPKIEEIRFSFNQKEHRFFISLFPNSSKYIILEYLCGKKTQETPKVVINLVVKRMNEYIKR